MKNFATMAQRFWEFKGAKSAEKQLLVHYNWGNYYHAMIADDEGNLLMHLIEDSDNINWVAELLETTGARDGGEMLINAPFYLLPKVFNETELPGFLDSTFPDYPIENGTILRTGRVESETPFFHAAIPIYYEAKKRSEGNENYVFVYVHEKYCVVFYFKNQLCILGNFYPVQNESEVLYFAVSPLKQAGIKVDQAKVELLANTEDAQRVMKTLERFLPDIKLAHIELPYPAGEYPPFAAEAFLLYQYLKCALQAENLKVN